MENNNSPFIEITDLVKKFGTFTALNGVSLNVLPADAAKGNLKELEAIAAAVIGGVVLTGGFGTILGIVVGAFIFGVAKEAFFYIPGIDGSFYRVFLGLVIIASALTNENIRKRIMGSI